MESRNCWFVCVVHRRIRCVEGKKKTKTRQKARSEKKKKKRWTYNDDGGQDDGQLGVLPPHSPLAFFKARKNNNIGWVSMLAYDPLSLMIVS